MAGLASGSSHHRVVHRYRGPAGSFVAVFTRGRSGRDMRYRFERQTIGCGHVAACALGGHRNIFVKLARIPACESGFVTGVAIGNHHARQPRIGNVVGRPPIGWRVASAVASRAFVGHYLLRVIPLGRCPRCHTVAGNTVGCGGNMGSGLADGTAAVVAAGAIGCRREQTVIRLGRRPTAGRLVAVLAITGHRCVNRRGRLSGDAIAGVQVASCALAGNRDVGMETARIPGCVASAVAGVTVGDHHARHCRRNMYYWFTVSRGIGSRVACRALGSDHFLGVVPLAGCPARRAVAHHAIVGCRNV